MREPESSILIHAHSKVGKTTLASSAPGPLLVADADFGWKFVHELGYQSKVKARPKTWDPQRDAPPEEDSSWNICVVNVQNWSTIEQIYHWLMSGKHPFKSFCIDSITEVQALCRKNINSDATKMQWSDWLALLVRMGDSIRHFRNLTQNHSQPLRHFICLAETKFLHDKWRPNMQGQFVEKLPYLFDIVGYLYADYLADETGALTKQVNQLLIGPDRESKYEAGSRVRDILGNVITQPNLSSMIETVYNHINSEN